MFFRPNFLKKFRNTRLELICIFRRNARTAKTGENQKIPKTGTKAGTGGYTKITKRDFRSARFLKNSFWAKSQSTESSCAQKSRWVELFWLNVAKTGSINRVSFFILNYFAFLKSSTISWICEIWISVKFSISKVRFLSRPKR